MGKVGGWVDRGRCVALTRAWAPQGAMRGGRINPSPRGAHADVFYPPPPPCHASLWPVSCPSSSSPWTGAVVTTRSLARRPRRAIKPLAQASTNRPAPASWALSATCHDRLVAPDPPGHARSRGPARGTSCPVQDPVPGDRGVVGNSNEVPALMGRPIHSGYSLSWSATAVRTTLHCRRNTGARRTPARR